MERHTLSVEPDENGGIRVELVPEAPRPTDLQIREQIDAVIARMAGLRITTDAEMETVALELKRCKETEKLVEAHYAAEKHATFLAYKSVVQVITETLDPLQAMERVVKAQLSAYQTERAARMAVIEEATGVPAERAEKIDGVAYVTTWKWEITDETAIPRDFLIPDTKRIGNYCRAMKESAAIPGIRFYSEKTVRVTT